ncbi:RNA polymerase sigma factor [Pedobacter aquatilis]|uniref:RNA polymerase sigma factor n=1 Tax=Pedobacter aquatilis TaxID=351343 RepID=UPI002930ECAB|nr:sigma-70 family RNA polymerase sigma factor [Pedobacter aquatilis]
MTEQEFNTLLEKEISNLRTHAVRYTQNEEDAGDLVQDTMIKALRFWSGYKPGTNFRGWLFVIMKNTFINDYRKNSKKSSLITTSDELSSQDLMISASGNLSSGVFIMGDIGKAMSSIPENYSLPFIRYFEGHKYHEIAEELTIPIGTVKTRIHMARVLLKNYLKTYWSD